MIKKEKSKKHIILAIIIVICLFVIIFNSSVVLVVKVNCNVKVGIIDSSLSKTYENINFNEGTSFSSEKETHGDKMIEFTKNCQKNIELYYYDAQNIEGYIDTESILKGLDWMVEHSVERVNLSLSNSVKHEELQKWILEHKQIKVFASYNNKLNSFDYPAMYDDVIASGTNSKVDYKDIDIKYNSSTIVVISEDLNIYKGNSYLSILTMLKKK